MKKLISTLASIPFSILAQQFPEAPMCFYALKTVVSTLIGSNRFKTLLAMDMKTHACQFNCQRPILITRVGYRAWKPGITYKICVWEAGRHQPLTTCKVTPLDTAAVQFFLLKHPVRARPDSVYYISRTYLSGGPNHNVTDYIGWLSNKNEALAYSASQSAVTISNGFFTEDINPAISDSSSNIVTRSLLPLLDFEYKMQY